MIVIRFELWDICRPATLIMVVEGKDCEKELGQKICTGVMVGDSIVVDNVRYLT